MRGLGERGAFHIDADEGFRVGGVLDHVAEDLFGERGREVHAHLGELDADVGVQLARLDGIEQLVVDGRGGVGLFGYGDAFAERVERDGDALAVHLLGGGQGLLDRHAGNKAAGELATYSGTLRKRTKLPILRHGNEERTQH